MLYQQKKRLIFVDILKALAIILVVIGHTPMCPNMAKRWIYSFHMPAFFAVYGMTYDFEIHRARNWLNKKFVLAKVKRLLVPCFAWGMIYSSLNVRNILLVIWGSQASFKLASSLSSLWFLTCMFLTVLGFEIIMGCCSKISDRNKRASVLVLLLILFFIIGKYLPKFSYGYFWCADVAFLGLAFAIIGYGFQFVIKKAERLNKGDIKIWASILFASFLLSLLFLLNLKYISINNVDIASRTLGNLFLYIVVAVAGIIMLTALSIIISSFRCCSILRTLGRYSLPLFLLHKPLVIELSEHLSEKGFRSPVLGLFISLFAVIICCFLSRLLELFAPNLIGLEHSPIKESE